MCKGLSHSWECRGWMLLIYFGSEHSRAQPYFRCSMLFVNISLRGIFHALQGVRAEVSITAVRLGSLPPRRCGSGHHSACLGEGPGTWPAVLMVLRGLIWSITGPSSTRLREVQSLPGVRPQSAAATLRPACQHRTESCAPAHLQPLFPSGRLSHEKHRAKPRDWVCSHCPDVQGPSGPLNTGPAFRCRHRHRRGCGWLRRVLEDTPLWASAALAQHSLSTPSAANATGLSHLFLSLPPFIYQS